MAELLVKAVDATMTNRVSDRQQSYKTGDVVSVEDDGFAWGSKEGPPKFQVVKFPGQPKADFIYLLDLDPGTLADAYPRAMVAISKLRPAMMKKARNVLHRPRKWMIDIDTKQISKKPIIA